MFPILQVYAMLIGRLLRWFLVFLYKKHVTPWQIQNFMLTSKYCLVILKKPKSEYLHQEKVLYNK